MKCQGENGFAGDAFALTSASGILLKPDKAWPERGPAWGRTAPAPARLGAARGPPPDFDAGEFAANLLQPERSGPPCTPVFSHPLRENRSLAELIQVSRVVPLSGGFDITVEQGQRRSRARQRVAKGPLPRGDPGGHWAVPTEFAGAGGAARVGTRRSPWKVGLLFVYSLL